MNNGRDVSVDALLALPIDGWLDTLFTINVMTYFDFIALTECQLPSQKFSLASGLKTATIGPSPLSTVKLIVPLMSCKIK